MIRQRKPRGAFACCRGCEFVGDDLLCNHYALSDFENAEAGIDDPDASEEGIALGKQIREWRDALAPDGCPAAEKVRP